MESVPFVRSQFLILAAAVSVMSVACGGNGSLKAFSPSRGVDQANGSKSSEGKPSWKEAVATAKEAQGLMSDKLTSIQSKGETYAALTGETPAPPPPGGTPDDDGTPGNGGTPDDDGTPKHYGHKRNYRYAGQKQRTDKQNHEHVKTLAQLEEKYGRKCVKVKLDLSATAGKKFDFTIVESTSEKCVALSDEIVRLKQEMGGGTPDSPGGTPDSPGGTPDSPGGTPDSPGGTPDSPGGTPDFAVQTSSPDVQAGVLLENIEVIEEKTEKVEVDCAKSETSVDCSVNLDSLKAFLVGLGLAVK